MQVIERNGRPFKLVADTDMKLTKDRTSFVDKVFLSINDSVDNWEEVGYEVWGLLIDNEIPSSKIEELNNKIDILKKEKQELKENIYILEDENNSQNEVIENMMMNILDLMCPEDIINLE